MRKRMMQLWENREQEHKKFAYLSVSIRDATEKGAGAALHVTGKVAHKIEVIEVFKMLSYRKSRISSSLHIYLRKQNESKEGSGAV